MSVSVICDDEFASEAFVMCLWSNDPGKHSLYKRLKVNLSVQLPYICGTFGGDFDLAVWQMCVYVRAHMCVSVCDLHFYIHESFANCFAKAIWNPNVSR